MSAETIDIRGRVAQGFEPMRDQLAEHFARGLDDGAGFAATLDGEVVVDLRGGFIERDHARPFTDDALVRLFSCSKAVSALVMALLVERGELDYEARVADLWPQFAAEGKDRVTVAQALSHQAGVPGFTSDWTPDDWFDWDKTVARLAAMAPLWEPGTASGYHAMTWGHLAGEIARRASGRTLGTILREDICAPRGIDFHIGLPEAEHGRVVSITRPRAIPDFGPPNEAKRAAFLSPWSTPRPNAGPQLRTMEIPAANGHGTAMAMARLMEPFARGGRLGDEQLLSAETVAAATAERVSGADLVLPYDLSFGAGLVRARPGHLVYGPGERTIGHTGYGGSFLMADPDRGLTAAYAMTKMNPTLLVDSRMGALLDALYRCL